MDNQKAEERFQALCRIFPDRLQRLLLNLEPSIKRDLQEIRLRVERPVQLCRKGQSGFLTVHSGWSRTDTGDLLILHQEELQDCFRAACGYSVHSHQNEIAQGFVTVVGGHRVGLSGTVVEADGAVTGMRDLFSMNVRVARELPGCADSLLEQQKKICKGILLVGPPSSGKTTLLRDLARQLSEGGALPPQKVTIVDERGELAACWHGLPQNDVGPCTDVLNGYSKAQGITMAVRALSPDFIVCDEIGAQVDVQALRAGAATGVKLIASLHAETPEDLRKKPFVAELARLGVFSCAAFLGTGERVGQVLQWMDLEGFDAEAAGLCADPGLRDMERHELVPVPPPAGAPAGGGDPPDPHLER